MVVVPMAWVTVTGDVEADEDAVVVPGEELCSGEQATRVPHRAPDTRRTRTVAGGRCGAAVVGDGMRRILVRNGRKRQW
jgi:hypothetical protein